MTFTQMLSGDEVDDDSSAGNSSSGFSVLDDMDNLTKPKQKSVAVTSEDDLRRLNDIQDQNGMGNISVTVHVADDSAEYERQQQAKLHQKEEVVTEERKKLREQKAAEADAKGDEAAARWREEQAAQLRAHDNEKLAEENIRGSLGQWFSKDDTGAPPPIRNMLGHLHEIMWEGSGWKEVGMGSLLDPNTVRKSYKRARVLLHPDKVGRTNDPSKVAMANVLFPLLTESYSVFENAEL
eukprot:TRINITY_DN3181_c1_g1_i2.p1 TRINITY_DN3181_c1_g1~~TRINITY_DN3181_c1_g1_i2.p1  ORF type:complete len:238 (+),score=91.34 TRINITY_DN3181_c1_g1_i2:347-1060(+)